MSKSGLKTSDRSSVKFRSDIRGLRAGAVELCAGFGGMGCGLRALGYEIAKVYDSWEEAVGLYNHNFPGEVATKCDLLSEDGRKLVAADRRRIGEVDLLAAGPPCLGAVPRAIAINCKLADLI